MDTLVVYTGRTFTLQILALRIHLEHGKTYCSEHLRYVEREADEAWRALLRAAIIARGGQLPKRKRRNRSTTHDRSDTWRESRREDWAAEYERGYNAHQRTDY